MRTIQHERSTAASAIVAYLKSRGIVRQHIANNLGIHKTALSRMLNGEGRGPAEQVTPELIGRIATLIDAPRAVEREWLDILEAERRI